MLCFSVGCSPAKTVYVDSYYSIDFQNGYHQVYLQTLKIDKRAVPGAEVINSLMGQMIRQYISFDCFLFSVLDVIFSQDHLPSSYSSGEGWLLEDVFDGIHLRYQ